jgi:type III secretion protein HrpB1
MNQQNDHTNCSHELIGALTELLRMGLVDQFPAPRVEIGDSEHLLEALHAMRPKLGELSLFDGFAYIVKGHWHDAIGVFETLAARSLCMPASRAMLVYCLSSSGNSDWRIAASQALDESLSPDASRLINSITALQDLKQARLDAAASGQFVMPESLRPFIDTTGATTVDIAPAHAAAEADRMSLEVQQHGYLRL